MLQAELKVVGGKHHGKLIPLTTRKFLIGREQDCQLRPNSELVSRHHCVFTVDDYAVRLRDLGSTNGTIVNDERIRGQVLLKSGDRVRIGKLDFKVIIRDSARQEEPAEQAGPEAAEATAGAETAELAGADTSTSFELPAVPAQPAAEPGGSDTTIMMPASPQNGHGMPQQPPQPPAHAPAPPPEHAYQHMLEQYAHHQPLPFYQPNTPYPPQPYPYQAPALPFPQPSMYPQHAGMPYPQAGPMYPQQPPPGLHQPQPPAEPEAPPESGPTAEAELPPIRLPDPSETGAQSEAPPASAEQSEQQNQQSEGAEKKEQGADDAVNPSQKAADIIRQHFHRRPPKKPE